MAGKKQEQPATQRTDKGLEIPVPKRKNVMDANGWGDFDGFRDRLLILRDHLHKNPKVRVRVT